MRQRKRSLGRVKAPLRRTPLRRTNNWIRLPASWQQPWSRWKAAVTKPGVCVVCGEGPKAKGEKRKPKVLDPHHVIPQRAIRRYMGQFRKYLGAEEWEAKLVALLYDVRNGLCVCRECHEAHEKRTHPIPLALVPASAIEFAAELHLDWMIERDYPEAS